MMVFGSPVLMGVGIGILIDPAAGRSGQSAPRDVGAQHIPPMSE